MAGVKASNGNHGQSNMPGRGLGFKDGERAPQGGSAEAGAAATGMVDDGERAPPGGAAEAGAAATGMLDDGERAPPGGSAEARAATMVVRDDGKRSAMSREQVAKSRSEANRVTGTVEQGGQLSVGGRDETVEGGNGGWRGYRGGRDDQATAASSSRPPAGQCQRQGTLAGRND